MHLLSCLLHLVQILTVKFKAHLFADTDPASTSGRSQRGPGVLVGSFNISEQDGGFPDLSRVCTILLRKAFFCLKIAYNVMSNADVN